jgi:ACS family tartrate transporter-like MFS transporter
MGGPVGLITIRKIQWHILPLIIAAYFLSYLDRVNIGFAAITMNKELALSAKEFGFGAGVFFLGYVLFEVPSNLILTRVGARVWLARIMMTWGVVSAATSLVWNAESFWLARFLLGVAEAGFFPGIIFYLTLWLPADHRARIFGLILAAGVISVVVGNPVSGWIMSFGSVAHLSNWQVLLIVEGIPSIIVGLLFLLLLPGTPRDVSWLSETEKSSLVATLDAERAAKLRSTSEHVSAALLAPKVWLLGLMIFPTGAAIYGLFAWLPQVVKGFGFSDVKTGFVSAIPFVVSAVAMVLWGRHSDRSQERMWHIIWPAGVAAVGLIASGVLSPGLWSFLAMTVGVSATFSALTIIVSAAPAFLAGTAAAAGIALVNAVGNTGSFAGPYMIGWVKDSGGTYQTALIILGGLMFVIIPLASALRDINGRLTFVEPASSVHVA